MVIDHSTSIDCEVGVVLQYFDRIYDVVVLREFYSFLRENVVVYRLISSEVYDDVHGMNEIYVEVVD
jgi:hypothetical protein